MKRSIRKTIVQQKPVFNLNLSLFLIQLVLLLQPCLTFSDVPVTQSLEVYENNILDSGGPLLAEQAAVNIEYYDINLSVDPSDSSISGYVTAHAGIIDNLDTYVAHLDSVFEVSKVEITDSQGKRHASGFEHTDGLVIVTLPEKKEIGGHLEVAIFYSGKPRPAPNPPWEGGFTWSESKSGLPWIGVSCQVNGADIWLPVKDHPSDRPDSVSLRITVPDGLTVLSNGVLRSEESTDNNRTVFHWVTNHPVSNYALTINIGPYEKLSSEFTSVTEEQFPVNLWVLPENKSKAKALLDQAEEHLAFFEKLLGPYPFRSEKYGIAEAPFFGMEHQTLIAYGAGFTNDTVFDTGSDFDDLHHHELAHEWWGNLITAYDWKDFWIHEGFATYMQPLYAEHLHGREQYDYFMERLYQRIENNIAVAPLKSRSTREMYDGRDIYMKGAWILHSLRYLTGDENFKKILRTMLYPDPELAGQSRPAPSRFTDTSEFIEIVASVTGKSLDWFFESYLRHPELPGLNSKVEGDSLYLSWSAPGEQEFKMPVEVFDGNTEQTIIPPMKEHGEKAVFIKDHSKYRIDPGRQVLRSEMYADD
ncbi:M1 family metallopeptidase [Natronogracilivirga saccharolytica]|uniref:Aminopeptidase N n=1 Tax=Natronogracilivirga saccharolytica TaxID=2812953 RepID=A0A8J7RJP5_9BACT|nr:M1 family metallopeptidase [Natronogracilivirga saccharolytica]MBP3192472.1 M1 family metallopeptidase [Natronogracilivirga saccharolytica]